MISSEVTVFLSALNAMSSRSSLRTIDTATVPLCAKVLPISDRVRAGMSAVVPSADVVPGIPVDLAHGDPVAVGRDERQAVVADLELHAGDHRGHVVSGCRDRDLRRPRSAKSSAGSTPVRSATSGRVGYSSTGMLSRVNRAEPQLTAILPSSVENCTGAFGSRLAMSASSRPETSAVPGFVDLGGDLGARRHLVVERRQDQRAIGRLEKHAAQDGLGRALRQKLDGE